MGESSDSDSERSRSRSRSRSRGGKRQHRRHHHRKGHSKGHREEHTHKRERDSDRDGGRGKRKHRRRHRSRSSSSRSSSASSSDSSDSSKRHSTSSSTGGRDVSAGSQSEQRASGEHAVVDPDRFEPHWAAAREVMTGLLRSLPALATELHSVLEMLDQGEALVVDGIADPLVRAGLRALCASLGLPEVELSPEEGAEGGRVLGFEAPAGLRGGVLQLHLGPLLQQSSAPEGRGDVGSASAPSKRVLGPSRPSHDVAAPAGGSSSGTAAAGHGNDEDDEGEDGDVGPLVPGDPRALHRAAAAAEARAARAAAEDEAAALGAARAAARAAASGNKDGGHEAWMSMPSDALFGGGKDAAVPGTGNKFATKSAPNAGIGWSYLAKPAPSSSSSGGGQGGRDSDKGRAGPGGGGGQPSASRAYMDEVSEARGGSLYDQYQAKGGSAPAKGAPVAGAAGGVPPGARASAAASAAPTVRRPFDRDKDLARPRQVSDPSKIVANAAALASRFGAGKFERSFL